MAKRNIIDTSHIRKKIRRIDVKMAASSLKKKSTNINKNSCDLFTAITYIKILVAYLIISYKIWTGK